MHFHTHKSKTQYFVAISKQKLYKIQNIVYNINKDNNIKNNLYFKKHAGNLESEVEALKTTGMYGSY